MTAKTATPATRRGPMTPLPGATFIVKFTAPPRKKWEETKEGSAELAELRKRVEELTKLLDGKTSPS